MKDPKKVLIFLAFISLTFVISLGLFVSSRNKNREENIGIKQISDSVELTITSTIGADSINYELSPGESVFDILTSLKTDNKIKFEYEEFSFGIFVNSINGYTVDPNTQYWSFEVNDLPALVGIKDYYPKSGDKLNFDVQEIKDYVE